MRLLRPSISRTDSAVPPRCHSSHELAASTARMKAGQIRRIRISGLIGSSIEQGMSIQNSRAKPADEQFGGARGSRDKVDATLGGSVPQGFTDLAIEANA